MLWWVYSGGVEKNETAKNVYNERKVTGFVALILMEIQSEPSFAFIKKRKKPEYILPLFSVGFPVGSFMCRGKNQ